MIGQGYLILCFCITFLLAEGKKHNVTLHMPDVEKKNEDDYLCSAFRVKDWIGQEPVYITKFKVEATDDMLHHMIIHACDGSIKKQPGDVWNCMPDAACPGNGKLLYAWEMGDPPSEIPEEVGFKVGAGFPFVVIQVHYAHEMEMRNSYPHHASVHLTFTDKKPLFYAGLYVLLGTDIVLPPQTPVVHDDVNCQIRNKPAPMTLFAYRTHAHSHGVSINGYLYRNDDIKEIVRGNLSQPQIFYSIPNKIEVDNGDIIACRCTYNTTGENHPISIGPHATDEMCNLYLMYYSKLDDGGFELCDIEENRNVTEKLSMILNEDIPDDTDRDQFIDDSSSFRSRPNKFVRPDLLM